MSSVPVSTAAKPRVLIADDSRIVRATLIKHIEARFDFREALDGEEAWEKLLIDPEIRVVITDLTMPKLDGYGLLKRIRASKISRIRNLPVVVVSGSDEQEERDRAKSFGATDLITKGIGTVQLLSRLDVLSMLAPEKSEEPQQEIAAPATPAAVEPDAALEGFRTQAEEMRVAAASLGRNFVLLAVSISQGDAGGRSLPKDDIVNSIARFLQQTVRQTDCFVQSGPADFLLATSNIHFDSARNFAQRVCGAIAGADRVKDRAPDLVATCGIVCLSEYGEGTAVNISLDELTQSVVRRVTIGQRHGVCGVVGPDEEASLIKQETADTPEETPCEQAPPDLATLLQWAKEGKRDLVMRHIGQFSADLQPLIAMLQK